MSLIGVNRTEMCRIRSSVHIAPTEASFGCTMICLYFQWLSKCWSPTLIL